MRLVGVTIGSQTTATVKRVKCHPAVTRIKRKTSDGCPQRPLAVTRETSLIFESS